MRIKTFLERWENSLRENTFLKGLSLLLALGLIVNGQFFKSDRVIIVPPYISKPFAVTDKKVSPEYMEQMAIFLSTFAASFTPASFSYNIATFLKYVDQSVYTDVKTLLMAQKARVEKEGVIQSFFPQKAIVYEHDNTADVIGQSIRYCKDLKIFEGQEGYRITFVYRPNSGLRIQGFRPLEEAELKSTLQGKIVEAETPFSQ